MSTETFTAAYEMLVRRSIAAQASWYYHQMTKSQQQSNTHCNAQKLAKHSNSLLYGVVNAVRAIPTMYGYAVIIFSHHAFANFMPALSKLVIFSSAVHQVMFTLMSTMPFAIGQVQDAGLIFLSAMATSICNSLGDDVSPEAKVATTIVTIGIATASLGVCLVIMGRFKLAALASYLPMPVIGGYLAFIGVFCLYAGLALSTGLVINDFSSMIDMFHDAHNVLLCVPGFLGGAMLLVVSQNFKNPFALSTAIMVMPVVFFLVLAIGSISLDQARQDGWVDPVEKTADISELVNLFDFDLVHWDQIPNQVVTWIGMVFIVAISSSLDVVAIEIDMGTKLDINHELKTVGWSNVVSGLLGGYTGSYIFGQTIFTCRSKTNSRIVGVCVILAEIAIVAVPVSVMSYVPRFFLAATLFFVALDLMLEWLVLAYRKIYIRVPIVHNNLDSSVEDRDLIESTVQTRKHAGIAHFEFGGYLFFGSAVQILDTVQKSVYVRRSNSAKQLSSNVNYMDLPLSHDSSLLPIRDAPVHCLDGTPAPNEHVSPTQYVVMDFTRVAGMDATATRGAFLILKKYCKNHTIPVVFANVCPDIRSLLIKNDVASTTDFFPTAESAFAFCIGQARQAVEGATLKLEQFQRQVLAIKRVSVASGSVDEDLHDRIRFACLLQEEIAKALARVPVDAANSLIKRKLCKDFESISNQLETAVLRVSAREQEQQQALKDQQQDGRIVAEHQGQVFEFAELENEIAHNEALIEEREQDINKIHQSVAQVNEIFRDLASIVQDQQGAIDDIETHVHESMQQTQQGLDEVKKASDAQGYCTIQ
ncbi:Sulfate Permease (SulP) Family [Phytophthora infestans T30-4]|uniref:Sulfate Permease (SulP) Family n=1 Tax=Phytophthora infestans (strain T30-4) TaxID=403677 RepID=D0NMJ9_PHYIT|nr:Sulfate Permease (SulP) Family [Phytophthora infestans T30-4]EEY60920.1 Sulfate Permease (SulP) Family [Phytophthora infestans T30-4]|eukprot:XP_002899866.1 Sulfate Permease (SulP) Family [Phytophthora infestans T30-4]